MKARPTTFFAALFALLLAGTSGCNSTPLRMEERAMIPVSRAEKKTIERRAAALRQVLSPLKVRGAGVSLSAYAHHQFPAPVIMDLIKKMGFNRIYCSISSESELSEDLEQLLTSAASAGIPVELMIRQGDFKHRFRGNALVRCFLPQFRQLPELAEDIADFNDSLPANAKLAGVTVRFEPHLFTHTNGAAEIPGLHYLWSSTTFGKGLDNDKLVELSMEQFKKMKKKLGKLPLSIELPDFYPIWVREGKLTSGSVKDLAAIGSVMIQCSGNLPSQLVSRSRDAMKEGKNMQAVIPVASHTSVHSGALRRRDWNDLVRALGYFVNSSRKTNCSGVVIRPLSELGYMLLEQD